ncbi:MAG TPA: hypothetical protein VFE55_16320 [Acidimicrobiia bacterium]|nr:hypothetical protein [Acidimicrobiia bacterium]
MQGENTGSEALDQITKIRPAVDRLRELLTSATVLDLQATARGYWAERRRQTESGGAERPAAI